MNLPSSMSLSCALAVVLSVGAVVPRIATAAPRAALVEDVQPSRPYFASVNGGAGYQTLGPGAGGVLGMTSLTLTNMSGTAQTVFVFAPVFAAGVSCGSTNVLGGSSPRFYVRVPASETVHLTYPTPVVFPGVNGQSCIAFGGATNIDINVNGYLN